MDTLGLRRATTSSQNEPRSCSRSSRGIQENVLELALRGQPRSPFYMVGRMGEQSVVIRAEKGKVKMLVEGEEQQAHREVIYNLEGGTPDPRSQSEAGTAPLPCAATSASSAVDLERAPSPPGSLSGTGNQSGGAVRLGEAGSGGDAQGAGPSGTRAPPWRGDPEKAALQRQSQELQAQLQVMEQTVRIRQWLEQPDKKRMRRPK